MLGDDAGRVTLVRGDITDLDAVERALDEHEITRVVHLAALQVPFVRANPPLGMRVNVAGTVNVLEAVARGLDRIPGRRLRELDRGLQRRRPLARARSGRHRPTTLYGVSKLADEGMARVYAADAGLASVGLRPLRRLRVGPRPGHDVRADRGDARRRARRAVHDRLHRHGAVRLRARRRARVPPRRADAPGEGAAVYNVPGAVASVEEVVAAIRAVVPDAELTGPGDRSRSRPSSSRRDSTATSAPSRGRPLADGVAATIAHFRAQQGS